MNFEDYETLPTNNISTHMMAGAIAGIMEHCIMYPVDSVKTRMQSLTPSPNAAYKGVGEALVRMVRQEGIMRPVRGMGAVIAGAGPAHALYFSCYEYLKDMLTAGNRASKYNHVMYGVSGCVATLLHDGIMNPAEVVKQRLQMYDSPYKSAIDCISTIYRTEGLKAFYRSYTTQLTMNIPFQSLHFMMYEFMQNVTNSERTYNPKAHVISGAVAGAVAAAVTTPLDVCKTLLNTQEAQTLSHAQQTRVSGLSQAVRTVYQVGGLRGYFQGMQARILYQMPSTAICWTTYEFFKYFLSNRSGGGTEKIYESPLIPASVLESGITVSAADRTEDSKPASEDRSPESRESWGLSSPAKSRELPVSSAAGLYGALSFTTVHENKVGIHKGTLLEVSPMSHS